MAEKLIELLEAEADECLKSAQNNGEYNAAFYTAHIVLISLARRARAALSETKE